MIRLTSIAILSLLCLSLTGIAHAQKRSDEQAIRAAITSYVKAFDAGEAAAAAEHWTPNGQLITAAGEVFKGRRAIQKSMEEFFASSKGARIEIVKPRIRFLSPSVAEESGVSRVIIPKQPPSIGDYVAIHVKRGEVWKLDRVEVVERVAPPSNYRQLKPLEFLIGSWVDAGEDVTIETVCKWTKNRNFISRTFRVETADAELEGTQIIGWDPARKKIRSWMFDSSGGFGVGVWTYDGKQWTVSALRVLNDGSTASAMNIYKPIDKDSFTFKSTGRSIAGEIMPDVDEVKVVRK